MNRRDFLKLFPMLAAYVALPAEALDEVVIPPVALVDKYIIHATAHGSGVSPFAVKVFHGDKPIMVIPVLYGNLTERDMIMHMPFLPKINSTADLRIESSFPCVVELTVASDTPITGIYELATATQERVLLIGEGTK